MAKPITRVVVPVALLAAVVGAVLLLRGWFDRRAKEAAAHQGIANIDNAVKAFRLGQGDYPPDLETLTRPVGDKEPPLTAADLVDPWDRPFVYERENRSPGGGVPRIYSRGADPDDPAAVIANW